LQIH